MNALPTVEEVRRDGRLTQLARRLHHRRRRPRRRRLFDRVGIRGRPEGALGGQREGARRPRLAGRGPVVPRGGDPLVEGLTFPDATPYAEVPKGTYTLDVNPAGTTDTVLTAASTAPSPWAPSTPTACKSSWRRRPPSGPPAPRRDPAPVPTPPCHPQPPGYIPTSQALTPRPQDLTRITRILTTPRGRC